MASLGWVEGPFQHHLDPAARQVSRTEPARKHLAVHARKLALQPDLQILRRHCRSLLRRLEQAHRSALADHVHRNARTGPPVLISELGMRTSAVAALSLEPPVYAIILDDVHHVDARLRRN